MALLADHYILGMLWADHYRLADIGIGSSLDIGALFLEHANISTYDSPLIDQDQHYISPST